ncbi:hypothetical protein L198_05414 [Cryptococcus wingfieldii CBS 7118]|uniref:Uncharacterized protein n=1 Tax=Cryptococcus wingfieldii CBS 7118 TaxID=1295528 RepID=A0A1E3IY75_9TREE|nr:hypothetical protein L198_05414 [Cryptococcus wingfieldii CBS 7118]ODN93549.1 hypothetical protein L198_05414 [Cryptococcus wingfieldii CBS 7118]
MSNSLPSNHPGPKSTSNPTPTTTASPTPHYSAAAQCSAAPGTTDALPDRVQANDPETDSCVTLVVPAPSSTRSEVSYQEPLSLPSTSFVICLWPLPKKLDACLQHYGLLETIPEQELKPFALRAFLRNSRLNVLRPISP